MQQAPQLSQADAKSALDDAIAAFQVEENKQKILKILADIAQLPPEQQVMPDDASAACSSRNSAKCFGEIWFQLSRWGNASHDANTSC